MALRSPHPLHRAQGQETYISYGPINSKSSAPNSKSWTPNSKSSTPNLKSLTPNIKYVLGFNRLLAKEAHSPSRGWPIRGGSPPMRQPQKVEDWGNLMACKHPPFYTCGTGSGEGARWPGHLSASMARAGLKRRQGDENTPGRPSKTHTLTMPPDAPVQGGPFLCCPHHSTKTWVRCGMSANWCGPSMFGSSKALLILPGEKRHSICIYVYMYIFIYVYISIYVCIYVYVCIPI